MMVAAAVEADLTLDTVGTVCPTPLIMAELKMKKLEAGQLLEVLADDPGVVRDFPVWCKNSGNRFLKLDRDKGCYRILIRKG